MEEPAGVGAAAIVLKDEPIAPKSLVWLEVSLPEGLTVFDWVKGNSPDFVPFFHEVLNISPMQQFPRDKAMLAIIAEVTPHEIGIYMEDGR